MVWEFPAVSQSRIEFWKTPQYSQSTVLWVSILFGVFGIHHFYLRSPQTGLLFIFGNLLTLGYWYFYDIIQLSGSVKELNTYGLSTPFGPAGIAQGMFLSDSDPPVQSGGQRPEDGNGPPNPIYFLLYALFLPILPLARLIAGDTNNALLSLFNATNPSVIVFNIISIVSEYFYLFLKPAQLLYSGIHRSFPFSALGFAESGFSKNLTGKEVNPVDCQDDGFLIRLLKSILSSGLLVFGRFLPPELVASIESALKIGKVVKEQVVDTALDVAQTSIKTAGQIGSLATQVPAAAASSLAQAASMAASVQSGGRRLESSSPSFSDYAIAGSTIALLLGGFVLHFGRSATDALRLSFGKDDSPPKASAV
jgi:TM2 domain-containing membrane protein YozV